MKFVCRIAALVLAPAAALKEGIVSAEDRALMAKLPQVPKVQNPNADGFPTLPDVGGLLREASKDMQGAGQEMKSLKSQLSVVERTSRDKLTKQKAAYDQMLRKQELDSRGVQAANAKRAKKIATMRKTAKETQAKISKAQKANEARRTKLRNFQQRLAEAGKATQDALVGTGTDEAKAQRQRGLPQASEAVDEESVDSPTAEDVQNSLSFLEINGEQKKAAKTLRRQKPKPAVKDTNSSLEEDPGTEDGQGGVSDQDATSDIEQSTQSGEIAETPEPVETAAADVPPVEEPVETDQKSEMPDADETQALAEESSSASVTQDASSASVTQDASKSASAALFAQGIVSKLSLGVKHVREQVKKSEAQLKLHFQKAYKAGKQRRATLDKVSDVLEKNIRSMQAQEKQLQASLAKVIATGKQLDQKIQNLGGFVAEMGTNLKE